MTGRWDLEKELLCRHGAAGAIAAITATMRQSVLILEKQAAKIPVNNSSMSGGSFISVNDEEGRPIISMRSTRPERPFLDRL